MPSEVLDEEKLTLFAAPRSSMERNAAVLRELTADFGGCAFWTLLDADRVFCLNCVLADRQADPGFAAGDAREVGATHIAAALAARSPAFVVEADRSRSTLLTQVRSHRGHDLGWIGLSLAGSQAPPDPAPVHAHVQAMFARAV